MRVSIAVRGDCSTPMASCIHRVPQFDSNPGSLPSHILGQLPLQHNTHAASGSQLRSLIRTVQYVRLQQVAGRAVRHVSARAIGWKNRRVADRLETTHGCTDGAVSSRRQATRADKTGYVARLHGLMLGLMAFSVSINAIASRSGASLILVAFPAPALICGGAAMYVGRPSTRAIWVALTLLLLLAGVIARLKGP